MLSFMSRVSFLKSALLIAALVLTGTESNAQAQTEVELVRGVADSMGNEIRPIGRAATLGEWKQSHQNYVIDGYTPGDAEFGNWCARAKLEMPLDGARLWVRTAYFYLPPVPTSPVLPQRLPASGLLV